MTVTYITFFYIIIHNKTYKNSTYKTYRNSTYVDLPYKAYCTLQFHYN